MPHAIFGTPDSVGFGANSRHLGFRTGEGEPSDVTWQQVSGAHNGRFVMKYWYNVKTGKVEDDDNKSPGENLMGPYDSSDEAAKALETAQAKTEAWDEEDRRWAEGD